MGCQGGIEMESHEIAEKLKEACPDKRISCMDARRLAEEWKIDSRGLGEICDQVGIKIFACELGCF